MAKGASFSNDVFFTPCWRSYLTAPATAPRRNVVARLSGKGSDVNRREFFPPRIPALSRISKI